MAAASDTPDAGGGEVLDEELAGLLEVERFEPPVEFREQALIKDQEVYERAARDPQAWWASQAEQLDWSRKWDRVLDDDLPKTRSGKIMRRLLRDIAEGRALGDVTTLRDPSLMAELQGRVAELRAAED